MCFSAPTFERITHCTRVLDVLFLSPPTYCTHLLSCSSASLLITGHDRPAVHYLDGQFESDPEDEAAFICCNSATGCWMLEDSSVPATNFTNVSVRLCCYLQSNFTQGPNVKLALKKKKKLLKFNKTGLNGPALPFSNAADEN